MPIGIAARNSPDYRMAKQQTRNDMGKMKKAKPKPKPMPYGKTKGC